MPNGKTLERFFNKVIPKSGIITVGLRGKSFINGLWEESDHSFPVTNPSNGVMIGSCSTTSPMQIQRAFGHASHSHMFWSHCVSPAEKKLIFKTYLAKIAKCAKILAELYTLESGKVIKNSEADIVESCHQIEAAYETMGEGGEPFIEPQLYNRLAGSMPLEYRVILAIKPPNFKAIDHWKTDPALISGSCVILKEAEQTPFTAMVTTAFFYESMKKVVGKERLKNLGGVLQLLQGPGEVGKCAVKNGTYDLLSFTGSFRVGGQAASIAASRIIPQHLELSGHNRILDWYDCPLETAAAEVVLAAFGDLKQRCVSTQVVFSPRQKELIQAVIEGLKNLKIGPPWSPTTDLGPFICRQYLNDTVQAVAEARTRGLAPLIGGYRLNNASAVERAKKEGFHIDAEEFRELNLYDGFYFAPAVYGDIPFYDPLMIYEVFGPLMGINDLDKTYDDRCKVDYWINEYIRERKLDNIPNIEQFLQGVALMNDNLFGLSGGCLTYDMRYLGHFIRLAQYGLVYRRGTTGALVTNKTKFGGVKMSGYGREGGGTGDHVQLKQIYIHFDQNTTLAQRDK